MAYIKGLYFYTAAWFESETNSVNILIFLNSVEQSFEAPSCWSCKEINRT